MARPSPGLRSAYHYWTEIETRWMDNDIYGHVNNVVYYSYFDTLIAHFLMEEGGLHPWTDQVVGMAVETGCRFHKSLAFPDRVHAGLRVGHLGRSSVRYEIGIFKNDEQDACAEGHFVHVFVERAEQRPVAIPEPIRTALQRIVVSRD
ncbi:MAG: thioesterase family protein [Geminicoccaceae bacterium]